MSTVAIELVHEECWICGAPFALSKIISVRRQNDGKTFTCPNNGCQIRYSTPTELTTARRERDEAKADAARWEQRCAEEKACAERLVRAVSALKSHIGRLKRRCVAMVEQGPDEPTPQQTGGIPVGAKAGRPTRRAP